LLKGKHIQLSENLRIMFGAKTGEDAGDVNADFFGYELNWRPLSNITSKAHNVTLDLNVSEPCP